MKMYTVVYFFPDTVYVAIGDVYLFMLAEWRSNYYVNIVVTREENGTVWILF